MNQEIDYKGIAVSIFEAMNSGEFSKFQSNALEGISFDFPGTDRIEGAKRVILFFKVGKNSIRLIFFFSSCFEQ